MINNKHAYFVGWQISMLILYVRYEISMLILFISTQT